MGGVLDGLTAFDQRAHRRVLFEVFQHLRDRFARLLNVVQATDDAERERVAVGVEEAAAHQAVGGGAGEQPGGTVVPLEGEAGL